MQNLDQAWLLYRMERYAQAEEVILKVIQQDPQNARAYSYLALIKGAMKQLEEARRLVQIAISIDPDSSYAHYVHALLCVWSNATGAAKDSIQEALRLEPFDPDYFKLLSTIHMQRLEWQEALAAVDLGLFFDPEHVDCLHQRGVCLYCLGSKSEAEEYFLNTIKQEPEHARSHAYLGHCYLDRGEFEKGFPHFVTALKNQPDFEFAQEGWRQTLISRYALFRYPAKVLIYFSNSLRAKLAFWFITGLIIFGYLACDAAGNKKELLAQGLAGLFGVQCVLLILYLLIPGYLKLISNVILSLNAETRRMVSIGEQSHSAFLTVTILLGIFTVLVFVATKNPQLQSQAFLLTIAGVSITGSYRCKLRGRVLLYLLAASSIMLFLFSLMRFQQQ